MWQELHTCPYTAAVACHAQPNIDYSPTIRWHRHP